MTLVLGLDIATRTGWALSEGGRCGAISLSERHDWACGRLYGALCDLLADHRPRLVVCEAPITMRGLNAKLVKLRGAAEAACYAHDVRVEQIAPSALKKWATGDGGADKTRMIAAARSWGYDIPDGRDDEADAALLARWGADLLAGRVQIQTPRKSAAQKGRAHHA